METIIEKVEKFTQSITLKAIIIGFLTLIMLIPGAMIQNLISERQKRSIETISKINAKWSNAQTINGPVMVIPYTIAGTDENNKVVIQHHNLYVTPGMLTIHAKLVPEERHYGIYKSILYKSELEIGGQFKKSDFQLPANSQVDWNEAIIRMGISDLRGLSNNLDFVMNQAHFTAEAGGGEDAIGQGLVISLKNSGLLQS